MFVGNNPLERSPTRAARRVEDCNKQTEFMKSNLSFLAQVKPAIGRSEDAYPSPRQKSNEMRGELFSQWILNLQSRRWSIYRLSGIEPTLAQKP
jgi:hypothetical protein